MKTFFAIAIAIALSSCAAEHSEQWGELSTTGYYFPHNVSRTEAIRKLKEITSDHGFHESASGEGIFDDSLHAAFVNNLDAVANISIQQNSSCIQLSISKRSGENDFENARQSAVKLAEEVAAATHWVKATGGCPYAP